MGVFAVLLTVPFELHEGSQIESNWGLSDPRGISKPPYVCLFYKSTGNLDGCGDAFQSGYPVLFNIIDMHD